MWADLVGQDQVVETLRRAVAAGRGTSPAEPGDEPAASRHAMSHAWLFTGPPGSGRSNAARAFAAALQCLQGGCGRCNACVTALSGAHPDVTILRTEALSIGVGEVRELVPRAATAPAMGRFQIVLIEDADRLTERGADALLKSLEEPAPRAVWMLCAPTAGDVIVTIRSRCRRVDLVTPSETAIAELLVRRDGVEPQLAAFAARASQGHIGRARALARDESARARRAELLGLPSELRSLGACLTAAGRLVESAKAEVESITAKLDARETAELAQALGVGSGGRISRTATSAMKELEDDQKARAKRLQRDALDRVLTELTSLYRDVLAAQIAPGVRLVNDDHAAGVQALAVRTRPEATLVTLDAIVACRAALERNVAPLLAMEALLIAIREAAEPEVS